MKQIEIYPNTMSDTYTGTLIGYRTEETRKGVQHVYIILSGYRPKNALLFSMCGLVIIKSPTPLLDDLRIQDVTYRQTITTYSKMHYSTTYSDLGPKKAQNNG